MPGPAVGPGDRVKLLCPMELDDELAAKLGKEFEDVPMGTCGTVRVIDAGGTIHVEWDNGRSLGMIPDLDVWGKL